MLIKTSTLIGPALDWAVAKCEGFTSEYEDDVGDFWIERTNHTYTGLAPFGYLKEALHFHTDWSQGGPIIERERISIAYEPSMVYDDSCRWKALAAMSNNEHQYGPTSLIAAMRCYVASKLGDTVEIPKELL